MGKGRKKSKSPASAPAEDSVRGILLDGLVGFACASAVAYLGMGLFGLPYQISFGLGPAVGLVAALACRPLWLAAPVAALGLAAGTFAGAPFLGSTFGALHRPTSYAVHALIAAAVAIGAGLAIMLNVRLRRWLAWLAVALTIVAAWQCGWFEATMPQRSLGAASSLVFYESTPEVSPSISDDGIFVLTVRRMQAGADYYSAMHRTLVDANAVRPSLSQDLSSPTSYRLPTLYWFLAALPRGIDAWVIAALVLMSAAIVAAWTIASRFTAPHVALVGVVAVAAYLHAFTAMSLAEVEIWAGPLVLIAVALALQSFAAGRRALVWAVAAASAGLLATLVRELAVGVLLLGLASTLAGPGWRARRLWIPWAAAIVVAVVAYGAHMSAVAGLAAGPLQAAASVGTHFDPTGRGLAASVTNLATRAWWPTAVGWLLWAFGTVGAVAAGRDWATRVLLGGVALGGAVALFFLHPAGYQGAQVPEYWGHIVLPTVVACCVLPLSRVPFLAAESVANPSGR